FVSYRAGKIDHYVQSFQPAIGSDNPSSRHHPLRVSPRKGSNQVPYKTDKALISEPIFSRPKNTVYKCAFPGGLRALYILNDLFCDHALLSPTTICGLHCGMGVLDCALCQAYNVCVIMASCERCPQGGAEERRACP